MSSRTAMIAQLDARATAHPNDVALLATLAELRLKHARETGDHAAFHQAVIAFERWEKASQQSADAIIGRAHGLLGVHRFHDALAVAHQAARLAPDEIRVTALLADVHLVLGNYTEAEALTAVLLEHEITLETLARRALVQFERTKYSDARTLLLDAIEAGRLLRAPDARIAWCYTVLADLEVETNNAQQAEEYLRDALHLDPESHHAEAKLARLLADRGEIEDAEEDLLRIVATHPLLQHRESLAYVMTLHGEPHDLREARKLNEAVEQELRIGVEHGDMGHARELVEFWLRHGRNREAAADLALRELNEVRRDQRAYELAAWALFNAGRADEAAPLARIAMRLAPNRQQTLDRCAQVLQASVPKPTAGDRAIQVSEHTSRTGSP